LGVVGVEVVATETRILVAPPVPVLLSVRVCDPLVVPVTTLPKFSDPAETLRTGVLAAATNSTAPASTALFVFLGVPKKSFAGAAV